MSPLFLNNQLKIHIPKGIFWRGKSSVLIKVFPLPPLPLGWWLFLPLAKHCILVTYCTQLLAPTAASLFNCEFSPVRGHMAHLLFLPHYLAKYTAYKRHSLWKIRPHEWIKWVTKLSESLGYLLLSPVFLAHDKCREQTRKGALFCHTEVLWYVFPF